MPLFETTFLKQLPTYYALLVYICALQFVHNPFAKDAPL